MMNRDLLLTKIEESLLPHTKAGKHKGDDRYFDVVSIELVLDIIDATVRDYFWDIQKANKMEDK